MLIAYEVAIELIREMRPVIEQIAQRNNTHAHQITDALNSVAMNLGEGQRQKAGSKRKAYNVAHGEAFEVKAGLDVAIAWGWIEEPTAALAKLDRLLGLLWGLTK